MCMWKSGMTPEDTTKNPLQNWLKLSKILMLFISYYYDNVYKLLKNNNRVMKLIDAVELSLMPQIDFEKYMPKRYKNKMIVFKVYGEEYVLLTTKEMRRNETSSTT